MSSLTFVSVRARLLLTCMLKMPSRVKSKQ